MEELLRGVASAVAVTGTEVFCHRGYISEVASPDTRFVVIPHEYFAVAPEESPALYHSTVAFGVEHPGTETFLAAVRGAQRLGAHFEISRDAVKQISSSGTAPRHFTLGYVEQWDVWHKQQNDRPIDVVYLGTADERRVGLLASYADDLQDLQCELLVPPHEPMTRSRPDFLMADDKWRLLTRSKVLVNLHREDKTAFEWVRCLEAMVNGCVVVSEQSSDLEPLVPGEHLLVADPSRVAAVARALVQTPLLRDAIANRAYDLCRAALDMTQSARLLAEVAASLPSPCESSRIEKPDELLTHSSRQTVKALEDEAPMAAWVPGSMQLPQPNLSTSNWVTRQLEEMAGMRPSRPTVSTVRRMGLPAEVDVVCVHQPGDGPIGETIDSLAGVEIPLSIHIAQSPSPPAPEGSVPAEVVTYLSADLPLGRGQARNMLIENGNAELLCILDAGDVARGDTLHQLVTLMADEPELDIAFAMATSGTNSMINALVPERRRLLTRAYLTRGYLVRRRWLNRIGGFTQDPHLDDFVDHAFWLRSSTADASVRLMRHIGFRLWPRDV